MKYRHEFPNMSFVHINPCSYGPKRKGFITNSLSRDDLMNAEAIKGLEMIDQHTLVMSPYWDINVEAELKRKEEEKQKAIERRIREREEVQRIRELEEQRVMEEELQRIRDQEQQNLMREKQILMERNKNYQKKLEELRVIMANPEKFRLLESRLRAYMENIRRRNESDQQ